jgi:four helix bundle suffix protein
MSGGFQKLLAYQVAEVITVLTLEFCRRYIAKTSRTFEQIVQALRSGKQNIVEGSKENSLKSYLRLVGVARASFEELKEDLKDYLRQRNLALWDKNDLRVLEIRKIRVDGSPYWSNLSNWSNWTNLPSPVSSAESFANLLITLISLETYLLDKLLRGLEEQFVRQGDFSEQLSTRRAEARRNWDLNRRQREDAWIAEMMAAVKAGRPIPEFKG